MEQSHLASGVRCEVNSYAPFKDKHDAVLFHRFENNVSANLTDVLAIVTSSCAGSFANTLSYFTKAGISIEYMYCFSIREKAILILRTNNRESAREVIRHQNLEYICESDLIKL